MYVFKDYLIKFMDRKIILSHTSPNFLDRAILFIRQRLYDDCFTKSIDKI